MAVRFPAAGVGAAALLLAATSGTPSHADAAARAIAAVTCGDIAGASPDDQAAVVYYAAGYREGLNFGRAAADQSAAPASSGPESPIAAAPSGSEPAGSSVSSSSAPAAQHGQPGTPRIVGGLTLQAQDIIEACGAAPDVLLTDIISNHGGATGFQGSPSSGGVPAGGGAGIAPSSAAPSGGETEGGASALSNSGANAVSNDLNAASGQLQQTLQSAPPIGGPTTAPAPGTASPAPGAAGPGTITP